MLGAWRNPVLIVGTDPVAVERLLAAGQFRCPGCSGVLAPWGHARQRKVRGLGGVEKVRPRRAWCSGAGGCGVTHVLLPAVMLARRGDGVEVIGAALTAKIQGSGHRTIARDLDRTETMVRRWLRRFARLAPVWRRVFTVLFHDLDPLAAPVAPAGSVIADVVSVIALAAAGAVRRVGPRPVWEFASGASGGLLLGPVAAVVARW